MIDLAHLIQEREGERTVLPRTIYPSVAS